MNSLFIVFEGIDGSGTSTQAELLKTYFMAHNYPAIISPEPTDGPIGKLIRQAMQTPILAISDRAKFDTQMAYLFAADRHYHLYNDRDGVFKLIERDRTHVITTRYYFSSLVYNCNTQAELDFVWGLNQHFPPPDLIIYLDLPVEIALSRIHQRSFKEIYETEEKLQKVRTNYHKLFQTYSGKILQLDGTDEIDSLHQTILSFIKNSRKNLEGNGCRL